ncbi:hypothetical protein JW960_25850 [candidate division KSB1 bacterium]|nr:hypothetical protein [candidate division KSB1 bacterium]
MPKIIKLSIARQALFILLLLIIQVSNLISNSKSTPNYYTKEDTWFESLFESRKNLESYKDKLYNNLTFNLGDWYSIGPFKDTEIVPFERPFPPEQEIELDKIYTKDKLRWVKQPNWQDDNVHAFEQTDLSAMYLFRTIQSKKDTTIDIYIGSDDNLKIWLNQNLVHSNEVFRSVTPGDDHVVLSLQKGENQLLMKVVNRFGGFGFCFSLVEGNPAQILWGKLIQDFTGEQKLREMIWEQADNIWTNDLNLDGYADLARRYLNAYRKSCEERGIEPNLIGNDVQSFTDVFQIRDAYIDSRTKEYVILTPEPPETPRINGPQIFGVRPGHPFLYTIPATGNRPIKFEADNLPHELALDASTGRITGAIAKKCEYKITLRATNAFGIDEKNFKIVVGDNIALTPPLGWNSWNCFGCEITAEKIKAAADAMVSSGLINHGWSYINIDDCWMKIPAKTDPIFDDSTKYKNYSHLSFKYKDKIKNLRDDERSIVGDTRDANGRILTNENFPEMKNLVDYIHNIGLKTGVYISPGPTTCQCYIGSYKFESEDARQFADWGFDYLKYDLCGYRAVIKEQSAENLKAVYQLMRTKLDSVDRDIVYSICQYGMADVWKWGAEVGGNCWRTTGDIRDTWESMAGIGFSQDGLEKYAGPGHWNDPDMLVVGQVGWGSNLHPTQLSANEQYTHISLWSLLCSPLLIGCDMTRLDPFTLNLLTNDEVLAVNQDPLGQPASRINKNGDTQIWAKTMEDGSLAIGLFNLGDKKADVILSWKDLKIEGKWKIRDLWRQHDLGIFEKTFTTQVLRHGVVFVRAFPNE